MTTTAPQGFVADVTANVRKALSIGIMPSYEIIGFFAPLLVVLGRLTQGLSAGVEIGGVSLHLAEIATPGLKGFL